MRAGYYNLWRGFAVEPREGDCTSRDNSRARDLAYSSTAIC
jgi:hypothetical protein